MAQSDRLSGPNLYNAILYGLGAPPDPESFDVSPRRRLFNNSGSVSVPLSSSNTATATVTLPDTAQPGSNPPGITNKEGLLFEFVGALVIPGDTTGHLAIVDAALQMTNPAIGAFLPLATPEATTLIPRVGTSLLFSPIPVLTATDIDQWEIETTNTSLFAVNGQPLKVQLTVSMANNDGAGAHSFSLQLWLAYRKISGLMGA